MGQGAAKCGVDTGILLEAGTNELEILILDVGGCRYGVNVAKVREVLEVTRPTYLPGCHPAVEGSVSIRGAVTQLVNLTKYLDGDSKAAVPGPGDRMLVMEFNEMKVAFRVHGVDQIVRTSWKDVQPMPRVGHASAPVTSVVLVDGRLVLMLDFETIAVDVGMSHAIHGPTAEELAAGGVAATFDIPILYADDSPMASKTLLHEFQDAGCTNIMGFRDGQEAWDYLSRLAEDSTPENIHQKVAGLVSDVEMPRMDGLNLTRRIREHRVLKDLPIVLFSSIVSRDNEKKGLQVGADAQVAKAQYGEVVRLLREAIARRSAQRGSPSPNAACRAAR
jgi:two-component system chemotaxis response regulator CheV